MERAYYLHDGKQQYGPYTLAELKANPPVGVKSVWYEGLSDWIPIASVPELAGVFDRPSQPGAPPPPAVPPPVPPGTQDIGAATMAVIQPFAPAEARRLADEIDLHYGRLMTFFIILMCTVVATVAFAAIIAETSDEEAAIMVAVVGIAAILALMIFTIVHFCKLHWRCWHVAIRLTGFRDHDEGRAVGFLFIPFFNLYWVFPSYQTLSQLLNRLMAQPRYAMGRPTNTGLATAYCILNICSIIPYLGSCIGLVNIFFWFTVMNDNKRVTTFILRTPEPAAAGAASVLL